MSVLDRSELEQSPLADLHAIASELGLDGFRRLRKPELVDAIVARQTGEEPKQEPRPSTRARGGGSRGRRGSAAKAEPESEPADAEREASNGSGDGEQAGSGRRRRRRGGGKGSGERAADEQRAERDDAAHRERPVEGVVELLDNGSAFLRLDPPNASDEDVYVSAAQVRRCELVAGDRVAGPARAPRRSERHPSLVRVETINGTPADEVAEGTRFDDLPAEFPSQRIALGEGDATLEAIAWLSPFGKGSRVTIAGAARAGKSTVLRGIAASLAAQGGIELTVALAGVRPEELPEWRAIAGEPAAALGLAAAPEARAQAIDQAVERARRVAARGADAAVLVDTLAGLPDAAVRRTLAAARNITGGGSLTVIATATEPFGGETTVIALDRALVAARSFPALDLAASGTIRAELLVGEEGARAIAEAIGEASARRS